MAFKTLGWDPMKDAFSNPNFNKYEEGPGGELDDDLQPGAIARSGKSTRRTSVALHVKNIPSELGETGVKNLCSKFGKIVDVKRYTSTAIVNCLNMAEAENVLKGVNDMDTYDMTVTFARSRESSSNNNANSSYLSNTSNQNSSFKSEPNMNNRVIKGPFSKPTKLTIEPRKPLVNNDDYTNSKLEYSDPKREYCGETGKKFRPDHVMNTGNVSNGRYNFRESSDVLNQLQNLSMASNGHFDASTSSSELEFPTIGTCVVCDNNTDKTCQRCGAFYCSLRCQRHDWPTHRPVCFPPPKLVPSTSKESAFACHSASLSSTPTVQSTPELDESERFFIKSERPKTDFKNTTSNGQFQRSKISDRIIQNQTQNSQPKTQPKTQPKNTLPEQRVKSPKPIENQFVSSTPLLSKSQNNSEINAGSNVAKKGPRSSSGSEKSAHSFGSAKKSQPILKMDTPPPSSAESKPILQCAAAPKNKSDVSITSVKDHRTFYVRSKTNHDNEDYVKNINDFVEYSMTAKKLVKIPEKGDIVLAEFEGNFYRALVLKAVSADAIHVAFIDYGNVEVKVLGELKELSRALQERKRYTFKIMLHNVSPTLSNDAIMSYLHNLVDMDVTVRISYDGELNQENKTVDLFDIENQESVTKYINELNKVSEAKMADDIIFLKDIETKPCNGTNFDVIVVDNSFLQLGFISIVKIGDLEELESNNNRFQEYCERTEGPYTPRINEMCLVKFDEDNVWYRGYCIEVVGDGHPNILFIDYGNQNIVPIKNIRKIPKEFAFPCITICCPIDGLPDEVPPKLADRLKELIPMNELLKVSKCEALDETGENGSVIFLPSVIDTLKKEKLL